MWILLFRVESFFIDKVFSNKTVYFEKYIIGEEHDEGSGKFNYEYTYSLLQSHRWFS